MDKVVIEVKDEPDAADTGLFEAVWEMAGMPDTQLRIVLPSVEVQRRHLAYIMEAEYHYWANTDITCSCPICSRIRSRSY